MMIDWHPVKVAAPGLEDLLVSDGTKMAICWKLGEQWMSQEGLPFVDTVTHWAFLPEPPRAALGEEK